MQPIPGHHGYYATSEGQVIGKYGRPLSLRNKDRDGYPFVNICDDSGGKRPRYVHKLIALAFHGPCPVGLEIDHVDAEKANNRPDNLEYVTHAENMRRARRLKRWKPQRGGGGRRNGLGYTKTKGRYQAQICRNGVNQYLGLFGTPEEARAAYLAAAERLDSDGS